MWHQYQKLFPVFLLILLLSGCTTIGLNPEVTVDEPQNSTTIPTSTFQLQKESTTNTFASPAQIKMLTNGVKQDYLLGPGDVIDISVWKRPELSLEDVIVAPDGIISIPKVGIMNVEGKTVAILSKEITTILSKDYRSPEATISIKQFHNNKAFVLGRVSAPGVVNFPGNGTLLEALALAGGLPHIGKETFLTKCAIIRGKETVIWIDLQDLLNRGNMSLNARIMNNDIIFIPEAEDELVMVLGEVEEPGPVMIKRGLNVVDAVMQAGGYTNDANLEKVFIIRQQNDVGIIKEINFKAMLETGDFSHNYGLLQDDIVYVGPSGMSKLNYTLEKLMPSLKILTMSAVVLENLGITATDSD